MRKKNLEEGLAGCNWVLRVGLKAARELAHNPFLHARAQWQVSSRSPDDSSPGADLGIPVSRTGRSTPLFLIGHPVYCTLFSSLRGRRHALQEVTLASNMCTWNSKN